jgi:hypothetical protein
MHMQHKSLGTLLLAFVATGLVAPPAWAASPYEWTVSQLTRGKTALVLTDAPETVKLKAGWACVVGSPDAAGGHESRTTTCRKNKEEFHFIVQCEPDQPKDDTMIQFGKGQESDYIEVACAPRRVALLPNTSLERTRER